MISGGTSLRFGFRRARAEPAEPKLDELERRNREIEERTRRLKALGAAKQIILIRRPQ